MKFIVNTYYYCIYMLAMFLTETLIEQSSPKSRENQFSIDKNNGTGKTYYLFHKNLFDHLNYTHMFPEPKSVSEKSIYSLAGC